LRQAGSGDVAGARTTLSDARARQSDAAGADRVAVLASFARAYDGLGDAAPARALLTEAATVARGLDEGNARQYALGVVVGACTKTGDVATAAQYVGEMTDPTYKTFALLDLAEAESALKHREAADRRLGQAVESVATLWPYQQNLALSRTIRVQCSLGNVAGAIKTAGQIPNTTHFTVAYIARFLGKRPEDVASLVRLANEITEVPVQSEAIKAIAVRLAEQGSVNEGWRLASDIADDWGRRGALREVIHVALRRNAFAEAKRLLPSIDDRATETVTWVEIVRAQALAGDLAGALQEVRGCGDDSRKAQALAWIAQAQAVRGLPELRATLDELHHLQEAKGWTNDWDIRMALPEFMAGNAEAARRLITEAKRRWSTPGVTMSVPMLTQVAAEEWKIDRTGAVATVREILQALGGEQAPSPGIPRFFAFGPLVSTLESWDQASTTWPNDRSR
jgi:hypothetical protein